MLSLLLNTILITFFREMQIILDIVVCKSLTRQCSTLRENMKYVTGLSLLHNNLPLNFYTITPTKHLVPCKWVGSLLNFVLANFLY
jgi:hypothetical protein